MPTDLGEDEAKIAPARRTRASFWAEWTAAAIMVAVLFDVMRARHSFGSWIAVVIVVAFAITAHALRAVTAAGAVAGLAIALSLWIALGWRGFAALFTVFVVTWAATRFRYGRKRALGIAERRGGRDALQIIANVGLAALLLMGDRFFLVAPVVYAVLAESAADTVSSEFGQAIGSKPRAITNMRAVPVGTDGAISFPGTLAGIAAGLIVAAVATLQFANEKLLFGTIIVVSGVLGMFFDSLLGATVEHRWLGNNAVNFLSTLFAALVSVIALVWL